MAPARKQKHPLLSDDALDLVAARFRLLADPSRLRILNVLMQGELPVQEITERTGLTQSNVSRHLGLMRREGLLERRADGVQAHYRINDPSVVRLCEIVCGGLAGRLSESLEALPDARAWKGYGI